MHGQKIQKQNNTKITKRRRNENKNLPATAIRDEAFVLGCVARSNYFPRRSGTKKGKPPLPAADREPALACVLQEASGCKCWLPVGGIGQLIIIGVGVAERRTIWRAREVGGGWGVLQGGALPGRVRSGAGVLR